MPRLTVWMLRTALIELAVGAALGAWLLSGYFDPGALRLALRQAHLDLLLFGWLVQFVLGVAYWMLPRYAALPDRGPTAPAWLAYAGFQAGLIITTVGEVSLASEAARTGRFLLGASALALLLLLWGRVKPFGAA